MQYHIVNHKKTSEVGKGWSCHYYETYFTLYFALLCFALLGGVSSDVSRSRCTPYFTVLSSVTLKFSSKDALVHFLMLSMYYILGRPLLLFPGVIPRMHVFTRLHLLFLHACPKKAIFLLIICARSSRLVWSSSSMLLFVLFSVQLIRSILQ